MPSFLEISPDKLKGLIGTPNAPMIIDVRNDVDFRSDKRFVPTSVKRDAADGSTWGVEIDRSAVIVCQHGQALSHGVAAHLRHGGIDAEVLEGGYDALPMPKTRPEAGTSARNASVLPQ
jgi:rhodanese-related sulfurtransferase